MGTNVCISVPSNAPIALGTMCISRLCRPEVFLVGLDDVGTIISLAKHIIARRD